MQLFTADRHLTDEAFTALLGGKLDEQDTLFVAEHIAECPDCALRLALAAQAPASVRAAPRGTGEQIRSRIRRIQQARNREFLRYCAGAVAGMAAIITLLFTAPLPKGSVSVSPANDLLLPEPSHLELPEPKQFDLPNPADSETDEDDEQTNGIFRQVDLYFRSLFGNPD